MLLRQRVARHVGQRLHSGNSCRDPRQPLSCRERCRSSDPGPSGANLEQGRGLFPGTTIVAVDDLLGRMRRDLRRNQTVEERIQLGAIAPNRSRIFVRLRQPHPNRSDPASTYHSSTPSARSPRADVSKDRMPADRSFRSIRSTGAHANSWATKIQSVPARRRPSANALEIRRRENSSSPEPRARPSRFTSYASAINSPRLDCQLDIGAAHPVSTSEMTYEILTLRYDDSIGRTREVARRHLLVVPPRPSPRTVARHTPPR